MVDLSDKKGNFITSAVLASEAIIEARNDLKALVDEWYDMAWSSEIVDGDFEGENEHLNLAGLTAVIVAAEQFEAWIAAGPDTNFQRAKR